MKKPLVYIACPYSKPDPVENTHIAVMAGQRLRDQLKIAVIIPHLTMLEHAIIPRPYQYWLDIDLDVLEHCDALFRLPGESSGADKEVAFAKANDIPVFTERRPLEDWVAAWKATNA